MKRLLIILSFGAIGFVGCAGPGRPPHSVGLPPIAEEYYACAKCDSLHGGIYGKGPLANFATANAATCWHEWQQIPKAEFQKRAAEGFPVEWEKTNLFVKRASDDKTQPVQ